MAAEIVRVLKPDGLAIINVPFLENVHNWPDDYYRYTPNGLRVLFRELEELHSGISAGPSQVLPDLIEYYSVGFSELQQGRLFPNLVTVVVGTVLLPLRALDRVFRRRPTYWRWARSYYYVGQARPRRRRWRGGRAGSLAGGVRHARPGRRVRGGDG